MRFFDKKYLRYENINSKNSVLHYFFILELNSDNE